MGRWTRAEIEQAFDRYQAAALKGAQEDAYDRQRMGEMVVRWIKAKERLAATGN